MSAAEQAVATEIQSSDRSIRDELLAARDEVEKRSQAEEAPETKATAEEVTESRESRARDDRGRFAPTGTEPVVEQERPAEVTSGEVPAEAVEPPKDNAPASVVAAPPAWSNAAKAKWNELPNEVRAEIAKRESDVHKGFTKMDEERAFGREIQRAISPYEALIRSEGSTPAAAVQALFNTAYVLRTGTPQLKAQALAQVAQQYGVDISALNQPQQQVDPQVATLHQKIAQLEAYATQTQQAQQQYVQQQALQTVEAFKSDPSHPYFEAVQDRMAQLLTSGAAQDLAQAYEISVWERPDLRQQLLAKAQPQQVARQKAEKARTKGVSVRGGAGGYQPPPANPNASVRDDLMAALEEARGRI